MGKRQEKADQPSLLPDVVPERRLTVRATGLTLAEIPAFLEEIRQSGAQLRASRYAMAAMVFAYWAAKFNHPRALLDKPRENRLIQRLAENRDDVSELLYAIDGASRDRWVTGEDPKSPRAFDGIEHIFRDRAQVERFAEKKAGYQRREPHPMAVKYGAVHD